VIVRRHAPIDLDEGFGGEMARGQDAAVAAVRQHGVDHRVLAGQHGEALGPPSQQVERLRQIAGTVLDADDVRQLGQLQQGIVFQIDRRAVGNVVDHHRTVGGPGDGGEMVAQAVLAGTVVVRTDGNDAVDVLAAEPLDRGRDLTRGVTTDADEHRNAPGHGCGGLLQNDIDFAVIESRRLAGGAQREQPADAEADVVLDQVAVARQVDLAILKRRDQRYPNAGYRSHGLSSLSMGPC